MGYLIYASSVIVATIAVGSAFGPAAGSVFLGLTIIAATAIIKIIHDLFSLNFRGQTLQEELREAFRNPVLATRLVIGLVLVFVVPFII
jgi:hypothetical protein